MRDWFPGFNWPDLIAIVIMVAIMYALARWADGVIVVRNGVMPLALVIAYVVLWRWRR